MGAHKSPYYRIVVADARSPRDGKFIEEIGTYNPLTEPSTITIDAEKAAEWNQKGRTADRNGKNYSEKEQYSLIGAGKDQNNGRTYSYIVKSIVSNPDAVSVEEGGMREEACHLQLKSSRRR